MDRPVADPVVAPRRTSSALVLSALVNVALLGWIAYEHRGGNVFVGDGVSLVLANDTAEALVEPSLNYPGGSFKLPGLPAGKAVGTTIPVPGEFEATLSYKDSSGAECSQPVVIRPLGELLIVVHVVPAPAAPPATNAAAEAEAGENADAEKPVSSSRVFVAYQGEASAI